MGEDLLVAADLRQLVLCLFEIDAQIGAALARRAVERVERLLQLLQLLLLLLLHLLPVGRRGRALVLDRLLQRADAIAHVLAFLASGHASGAGGEGGEEGEPLHLPPSTEISTRRFFAQADSSWPGSTGRSFP